MRMYVDTIMYPDKRLDAGFLAWLSFYHFPAKENKESFSSLAVYAVDYGICFRFRMFHTLRFLSIICMTVTGSGHAPKGSSNMSLKSNNNHNNNMRKIHIGLKLLC
ncbi:hypothetical protein QTP88_004592 [Uroleucon formosanum]